MYFVNERWLGGTLTNFKTIRSRVRRMDQIDKMEEDGTFEMLPKKEVIGIKKEYAKLDRNLRGIRAMNRLPQALIIVDPRKEENAIREAHILGIPVFGIVDTNCDPDLVDYVIPGNDDAVRAVKLLIGVLTNAIAEVNGNEVVDYINDDDKAKVKDDSKEEKVVNKEELKEEKKTTKKATKKETKKEEVKEDKKEVKETPKKEEKKPAKKETKKAEKEDLSKLTLVELKKKAKEAGIKGYSTMKKAEVIEALNK